MFIKCKISLYAAIIYGFTFLLAFVIYNHYGNSYLLTIAFTAMVMAGSYLLISNLLKTRTNEVDNLHKSINDILASEDYTKRLSLVGDKDLDRVIRSLNILLVKFEDNCSEIEDAKLEMQLTQEFKDEFIASVTHELRTPMHAILSFSRIGCKKIKSSDYKEAEKYLCQIERSGDRLLSLINDVLKISKLETGHEHFEMRKGNLIETVEEIVNECDALTFEKDIKIKINNKVSDTSLVFDHSKIEQVVSNLLSNAIKFSPNCGNIKISFEQAMLSRVPDTKKERMLVVSIEDDGIGIPESEAEKIFEKFSRSSASKDYPGTGLGLAISRKIIEAHNGKIWAESNKGIGSCFYFALPINREEITYNESKAA